MHATACPARSYTCFSRRPCRLYPTIHPWVPPLPQSQKSTSHSFALETFSGHPQNLGAITHLSKEETYVLHGTRPGRDQASWRLTPKSLPYTCFPPDPRHHSCPSHQPSRQERDSSRWPICFCSCPVLSAPPAAHHNRAKLQGSVRWCHLLLALLDRGPLL